MILKKGIVVETVNDKTTTREMTEDEIKGMMGHLRFNTGMSLPDQLIHDFMGNTRMLPTFKKCVSFNREDFNDMVKPLKRKKLKRPRAITRKGKAKGLSKGRGLSKGTARKRR